MHAPSAITASSKDQILVHLFVWSKYADIFGAWLASLKDCMPPTAVRRDGPITFISDQAFFKPRTLVRQSLDNRACVFLVFGAEGISNAALLIPRGLRTIRYSDILSRFFRDLVSPL
jgi:hypothetical protein